MPPMQSKLPITTRGRDRDHLVNPTNLSACLAGSSAWWCLLRSGGTESIRQWFL